ncbi:MAG: hypothetical protein Q8L60_16815 [Gammaproteobacteria bacterium]|nr:hypothetical protein [Gammaproteobacteria bacterium]MDP2140670.1 hypothetical protein [Gammaproteobacteria bacterium]MDP2346929.1 hypothetical protein [Gammaproteobacteria bacterium]
MRFDIYGQFEVEVVQENGQWVVYRMEGGSKSREYEIVIPAGLNASGVLAFLDDAYFEFAESGERVTQLE